MVVCNDCLGPITDFMGVLAMVGLLVLVIFLAYIWDDLRREVFERF